ncbi:hypothetical protein HJG53_07165 [Sphingomonas sp. ID1715]|uniref:hypothetical protein n=1 Tax=Sphingomonas sp. ID1715 TaxID=1656898 RepID=UPI001487BA88|nr:hypothetical protein [Sphingomonas sp. ID1715]NNM76677.1 hypothetical protein [Sphingomonas sp. ID1715]
MPAETRRKGAPWTEADDAELRRRCEAGEFLEDIAKALGRSSEGVRTRANLLGIPCKSGRSAGARKKAPPAPKAPPYRLVCRKSDGSTESVTAVDARSEAEAVAVAQACVAEGGCELWRTGSDPVLVGRY